MIRIIESRCINPHGGRCGPHYSIDFGECWSRGLNGCGGPYREIGEIDPKSLSPRMRQRVQREIAKLIIDGVVSREDGEKFLDRIY